MSSHAGSSLRRNHDILITAAAPNRPWLPPLIVAAGALAFGMFAMNTLPIGVYHDDARYLVLARALAEGKGFRVTSLPGAPAGVHFPPGYPLLLAAVWRLAPSFPGNVVLFKLLNAVLLSCAGLATYAFARVRGELERPVAVAVALVFAGTVPVLFLDGLLLSEPFFAAAFIASLLLAERVAEAPAGGVTRTADDSLALAAGLVGGGVTMIRSLGFAMVIGLCTMLLLRRRRRATLLVLMGACVFIVPWQLWTLHHGHEIPDIMATHYGTYGAWLAPMLQRDGLLAFARVAVINLRGLTTLLTPFGVGGASPVVRALVAVPLFIACAIGLSRLVRRAPVSVVAAAAYLGVLLLWPWEPDRYFWLVWPLVLTAIASGVVRVATWNPSAYGKRAARGMFLAALAACATLFVGWHAVTYRSRWWEDRMRNNARIAVALTKVANSLPDGLIACEFDALVVLYTGRAAVPIRMAKSADFLRSPTADDLARELLALLDTYHPRFLLITFQESRIAAQRLATGPSPRLRFAGVSPEGVEIYGPVVARASAGGF